MVQGSLKALRKELFLLTEITLLFAYFYYFRGKYLVVHSQHHTYMWIEEMRRKYDSMLKVMVRQVVRDSVFKNEAMAPWVSPMLIDLVQMPNIKALITDLLIQLYSNTGFVNDTKNLTQ